MPEAVVFDIQRGSFVDGPGIRTAVFLKGCGLRCAWCHNPESWEGAPQLLFFANRCTGCGACLYACPRDAIRADGFPDPRRCAACGICADACPAGARRLCGTKMTAAEAAEKCAADKPFYDATGGGVTFTGGECLLQPEFVAACAALLEAKGVASAVDTAGDVPWEAAEKVMPHTALFLYDMKCLDELRHKSFTGRGNRRILENLDRLLHTCPERVEVRIPLVPGFNDIPAEIAAMGDWLAARPLPGGVALLPYHAMGAVKAAACGEKTMETTPPSKEEAEAFRQILRERLPGIRIS